MKNKKGATTQIALLISLSAALITLLSFAGVVDIASITGSGDYIERPVFYYDKCEATGSYKYSTDYNVPTSGGWLNSPSVTDQYNVVFDTPDNLGVYSTGLVPLGGHRINYYVCNSRVLNENNCRVWNEFITSGSGEPKISNIKPTEYVWTQYQKLSWLKWKEDSGATYQLGFIPYGLRQYNVLGGSGSEISANSCSYSSNQYDTLLSSDSDEVKSAYSGVDKGTNERVLQPEEVRWYVAGYLTSASPSFTLTYKFQDAWCKPTGSSAEIYSINEIQTRGGTYKVASADWSDYLGSVTCCPGQTQGDQVCNDNFKWETVQGSECSVFKSCGSSSWTPYDTGEIIKYSCVNGYCESETKEVECASNFDCEDSNQVCDLNSYTCENANVYLDGQVIETLPDSPQECEERGGTWIKEESTEGNLWSFIGLADKKVVVQEYCELDKPFNYTKWILIVAIVLFVLFFRNQIFAIFRTILGKLGVKI